MYGWMPTTLRSRRNTAQSEPSFVRRTISRQLYTSFVLKLRRGEVALFITKLNTTESEEQRLKPVFASSTQDAEVAIKSFPIKNAVHWAGDGWFSKRSSSAHNPKRLWIVGEDGKFPPTIEKRETMAATPRPSS